TAQPADGVKLQIYDLKFEFDDNGVVAAGSRRVAIGATAKDTFDNLVAAVTAALPGLPAPTHHAVAKSVTLPGGRTFKMNPTAAFKVVIDDQVWNQGCYTYTANMEEDPGAAGDADTEKIRQIRVTTNFICNDDFLVADVSESNPK